MTQPGLWEMCFAVENDDIRDRFVKAARGTDGADVVVEGRRVLVRDRFTFDHLSYHYLSKYRGFILPERTYPEASRSSEAGACGGPSPKL